MERKTLMPGTVLKNRYVIECTVGLGGFGTAYRAADPILNVTVAIKEYRQGTERFLREARIMARFRACANIVYVYDFFEENGSAFIVMEFLEGETLKERISRNGCIPTKEAAKILIPVLKALETVHRAGVIHKDVAPDNIYLLKNGKVKLFDFGTAVEQNGSVPAPAAVKNGYSPPELYHPEIFPGPECDVYAAGATLYRMITAKIPPAAPGRISDPGLSFETEGKHQVDRNLAAVIRKAMQTEPGKRYQSALVMRRELERYLKRGKSIPTAVLTGLTAVVFIFLWRPWVGNAQETEENPGMMAAEQEQTAMLRERSNRGIAESSETEMFLTETVEEENPETETSENETSEFETSSTETTESGASSTETSESEAAEPETATYEISGGETSEAESTEAESTEAETMETETSETLIKITPETKPAELITPEAKPEEPKTAASEKVQPAKQIEQTSTKQTPTKPTPTEAPQAELYVIPDIQ